MKTGYTCAAGYNVVASAERNGRRLLTVVLGAPSTGDAQRNGPPRCSTGISRDGRRRAWASPEACRGRPSGRPTCRQHLRPRPATPSPRPRPRTQMPRRSRRAAAAGLHPREPRSERGGTAPADHGGPSVMSMPRAAFVPVRVFIGPVAGWSGPIAQAQAIGPDAKEFNRRRKPCERCQSGPDRPAA